ncbi:MAG: YdeI/OmpD-associated family protein [Oscillospiraceae bacterium]|nr:YdeI/OmpD-associated family protein [Oscillospiraceae bacterium]
MSKPFIGMGKAPDGVDLPLGLSMGLSMHPRAMDTFGKMTHQEKTAAIQYVQSATTGQDAKRRIENAIQQMEHGQTTLS